MKRLFSRLILFTCALALFGCAASYKPISPAALNYNSHDFQDGINLSYKYDVLRERGNKKFAGKETKKGVKLVAVKVTNNSEKSVIVGKDIAFYSGQNQIIPMEPMAIKESIKQVVPGYIPYLLLTFVNLTYTETSNGIITEQKTYPTGLALGPGITIGNMAVAGSANKKMLSELLEYNILDKEIKQGETVYGIIGIRGMGYSPISVRMTDSSY